MRRILLLIIILLLCYQAFSQNIKRETLLEAHQLLGNFKWENWQEAEKLILPLAENGDAEAQYLMAKVIRFKIVLIKRKQRIEAGKVAWSWLLKANKHDWLLSKTTSDEDSLRAQYVAVLNNPEPYSSEKKTPNYLINFSLKKRTEILRKAAEKNILEAQLLYSDQIRYIDSLESFKWLKIAADNGNAEALLNLGSIYLNGKRVKKDINKAIDYYNKSMEGGSYESAYKLGLLYKEGKEVERDLDKAIEYFNRVYLPGHNSSQLEDFSLFQLANIYIERKEYQKAIDCYKRVDIYSIELKEARYKIGVVYATLEQFNKAVYWLKKSNYKDADQKLKEIRNR